MPRSNLSLVFALAAAASGGLCGGVVATRLGGGQLPGGDEVTELRDASGAVRVRLGCLDAKAGRFGVQMLDAAGAEVASVTGDGNESAVVLRGGAGGIAITANAGGEKVVLGDDSGWHMDLERSKEGLLNMRYRKKDMEPVLALACDMAEGNKASFVLFNGRGESVYLGVRERDARMGLARDGATAVLISAETGVGAALQLGVRALGLYLQALADGTCVLEMRNGGPFLSLQNTAKGVGYGISKPDGEPIIRIGVNPEGEVRDSVWDKSGKEHPRHEPGKERK